MPRELAIGIAIVVQGLVLGLACWVGLRWGRKRRAGKPPVSRHNMALRVLPFALLGLVIAAFSFAHGDEVGGVIGLVIVGSLVASLLMYRPPPT